MANIYDSIPADSASKADGTSSEPPKKSSNIYDAIPAPVSRISDQKQDFLDRNPVLNAGLEGAGWAGAMVPIGKGMEEASKFVPGVGWGKIPKVGLEVIGKGLQESPKISMALGAASGAAGEAARKYGKGILPDKWIEPVAIATELATPYGAGKVAKTAVHAAVGVPTAERQALAEMARSKGFELEPNQIVEGGEARAATQAKNQKLANKLVTEKIGTIPKADGTVEQLIPAGKEGVSARWIQRANEAFSREYGKIYTKDNVFALPPESTKEVMDHVEREVDLGTIAGSRVVKGIGKALLPTEDYERIEKLMSLEKMKSSEFVNMIKEHLGTQSIVLNGEKFGRLRNELSEAAYRYRGTPEGEAIGSLLETVDNSVRAANPQVAQRLSELNPRYRAYKDVEKLAVKNKTPGGNISLKALGEHLVKKDAKLVRAGQGGQSASKHILADEARFGREFGLEAVGEGKDAAAEESKKSLDAVKKLSKTASRAFGGTVGAGIGGTVGGPVGAALGAGGGALAQYLANAARKGYLGQRAQMAMAEQMRGDKLPWEVLAPYFKGGISGVLSEPSSGQ